MSETSTAGTTVRAMSTRESRATPLGCVIEFRCAKEFVDFASMIDEELGVLARELVTAVSFRTKWQRRFAEFIGGDAERARLEPHLRRTLSTDVHSLGEAPCCSVRRRTGTAPRTLTRTLLRDDALQQPGNVAELVQRQWCRRRPGLAGHVAPLGPGASLVRRVRPLRLADRRLSGGERLHGGRPSVHHAVTMHGVDGHAKLAQEAEATVAANSEGVVPAQPQRDEGFSVCQSRSMG